eukprot:251761-Amphidinium_carterae.1
MGSAHTCVLCDGGSVKCWGDSPDSCQENRHGDAPGSMGDSLPAVDFGIGKRVVAVHAGSLHTCVILHDGTAKCCGHNLYGQLGYADSTDRYLSSHMGDDLPAIDFGTLTPQSIFCAYPQRTAVFFTDGSVRAIGLNTNYQLGYSDATDRNSFGDTLPAMSLGNALHAVGGGFGH